MEEVIYINETQFGPNKFTKRRCIEYVNYYCWDGNTYFFQLWYSELKNPHSTNSHDVTVNLNMSGIGNGDLLFWDGQFLEKMPFLDQSWIDSNVDTSNNLVADKEEKGLRFNEGKLRYDLVHPLAHEGMVGVLTFGAKKYSERNWEKGMKWSNVISSMKRHIAAIEKGEDYDPESGILHVDHVACNAHFLSAYYRNYPQGDDRPIRRLPRIGLDIDGVLADFVGSFGIDRDIECWNDPEVISLWNEKKLSKGFAEWSLGIKPLVSSLPFEPVAYITARPESESKITQDWLDVNGFPRAPLSCGVNKVEACKKYDVEIFVDDSYDNFLELNDAGIFCYQMNQTYNSKYVVGHKRLMSLNDLRQ